MQYRHQRPSAASSWPLVTARDDDVVGPDPGAALRMPTWHTRMVGRHEDCLRLRELLIDEAQRLVVITGTGGVGKTRLAVAAAGELRPHFRHGTHFLSFSPVPGTVDLDAAFARLLGLRDVQDQSHRETIARHLHAREMLIVVDNVEHMPHIADLLRFLQERCQAISLLVTSRHTLGIYGEVVYQVFPFSRRADDSLLPDMNPATPMQDPAVQLFREVARAVVPDFEVTPDTAEDVAAICDQLGGLPLAIELTAPRLATRTPAALRRELEHRAALPDDTPGAMPVMTMDATLRLSYDHLDPDERQVFRAICMMRGHWTIDDVLPILPPGMDEMTAISHLDTLVARSLVSTPPGPDEEPRFTINPVLRQFGRGQLVAEGEDGAVAHRHADRLIDLGEMAEPELTGPNQRQWLARIAGLYEDLRAAHAYLREQGRSVDALRLATALWRYTYTRGHYREGRVMLEESLCDVAGHDALRSRACNGLGLLANVLRDADAARQAHETALALATRLGLQREIALSRIGLADVDASFENDTASALRHLGLAAEAYEQIRDTRGIASVLTNQGNIQWTLGQLDRAFTTHEEARMLYAQINDERGMAWSDTNTGRIAAEQRRFDEAVPRLLSAVDGYVRLGDAYGLTEVLEALAGVSVATGDLETASLLAGAATTMRATIGTPLKSSDLEQFQQTLAAARQSPRFEGDYARGAALSPEEAIAIARSFPIPEPAPAAGTVDAWRLARDRFGITRREHEVLLLLGEGLTDQQIADRLGLSRRTVQTHMSALLRKLEVPSRVSAVRTAHQAGIVPQRRW